MKIKDYSIIETEWIDELIDENSTISHYREEDKSKLAKLRILEQVKSKLKPLTAIVENAFDAGVKYCDNNTRPEDAICMEDYINDTII